MPEVQSSLIEHGAVGWPGDMQSHVSQINSQTKEFDSGMNRSAAIGVMNLHHLNDSDASVISRWIAGHKVTNRLGLIFVQQPTMTPETGLLEVERRISKPLKKAVSRQL
jgi:hypothetical protein